VPAKGNEEEKTLRQLREKESGASTLKGTHQSLGKEWEKEGFKNESGMAGGDITSSRSLLGINP